MTSQIKISWQIFTEYYTETINNTNYFQSIVELSPNLITYQATRTCLKLSKKIEITHYIYLTIAEQSGTSTALKTPENE